MPSPDDLMKGFQFGRWSVLPARGLIRDGETERHIEPLVMDVFVVLASHEGDVVNRDQLVDAVWGGRPVTDEVITRCIAVLRRNLGDDAKSPQFIETLPRRGYRTMQPIVTEPDAAPDPVAVIPPKRVYLLPLLAGFAAVLVIAFYSIGPGTQNQEIDSIAVFQFECRHDVQSPSEHLCFGFSEEAITSLKKIAELQVVRIRDVFPAGRAHGQDGIVTGSVQIIGNQVKVSAQLEDARDQSIVWSDTFDAQYEQHFCDAKTGRARHITRDRRRLRGTGRQRPLAGRRRSLPTRQVAV